MTESEQLIEARSILRALLDKNSYASATKGLREHFCQEPTCPVSRALALLKLDTATNPAPRRAIAASPSIDALKVQEMGRSEAPPSDVQQVSEPPKSEPEPKKLFTKKPKNGA